MQTPPQPSEILRRAVLAVLRRRDQGVRSLEREIGLKPWSLRGIVDQRRPQIPSIDRAAEVCDALGLELYIGPPRPPAEAEGRAPQTPRSAHAPAAPESAPAPNVASLGARDRAREDPLLAELLALVADAWESAGGEAGRLADLLASVAAAWMAAPDDYERGELAGRIAAIAAERTASPSAPDRPGDPLSPAAKRAARKKP